jgi:hypothetical protein
MPRCARSHRHFRQGVMRRSCCLRPLPPGRIVDTQQLPAPVEGSFPASTMVWSGIEGRDTKLCLLLSPARQLTSQKPAAAQWRDSTCGVVYIPLHRFVGASFDNLLPRTLGRQRDPLLGSCTRRQGHTSSSDYWLSAFWAESSSRAALCCSELKAKIAASA